MSNVFSRVGWAHAVRAHAKHSNCLKWWAKSLPTLHGYTAGMTGKSHSEETKRKISEGNKGKVISEESKKKMSEAAKKRWAKNSNTPVL